MHDKPSDDGGRNRPPVKDEIEARQGVTGHKVRYVLTTSLALAVIALLVTWLVL